MNGITRGSTITFFTDEISNQLGLLPITSITSYSGVLKRWNGSAWARAKLKRYNGTFMQVTGLKRWTGASWVLIDANG